MDIGNILQAIDFGKRIEQYVRELENIISPPNIGPDNKKQPYVDLIQIPQKQDTEIIRYEFLAPESEERHKNDFELLKKLIANKDVIRIMSFDVSGWKKKEVYGSTSNIISILEEIQNIQPTILCLQYGDETKTHNSKFTIFLQSYNLVGKCVGPYNMDNSIYIKKNSGLEYSLIDASNRNIEYNGDSYCGVFVDIKIGEKVLFSLGNVLLNDALNAEHRKMNINRALSIINQSPTTRKIILGNMNSYREDDYHDDEDYYSQLKVIKRMNEVAMNPKYEPFAPVKILEDNGWTDSFVKYFATSVKELPNPPIDPKVPINTSISGGRTNFIFVNETFDIPILGCYKVSSNQTANSAIIMDLYYKR